MRIRKSKVTWLAIEIVKHSNNYNRDSSDYLSNTWKKFNQNSSNGLQVKNRIDVVFNIRQIEENSVEYNKTEVPMFYRFLLMLLTEYNLKIVYIRLFHTSWINKNDRFKNKKTQAKLNAKLTAPIAVNKELDKATHQA